MTDGDCQNTDTPLFQELGGDAYSDSCHMTQSRALGINVGGRVEVKTLREWASSYETGFREGKASRDGLMVALLEILKIQNKVDGGEWDEIEEARKIAKKALEAEGVAK